MARADDLRLFRERWRSISPEAVDALRADVLAATGEVVSPFGEVGGRQDLRGLAITSEAMGDVGRLTLGDETIPSTHGPGRLRRWTGLDFTAAVLSNFNWYQHEAVSCIFDDANLEHIRCWGVLVEGCSFQRASLYYGQLGASAEWWPNRSIWKNSDFSRADLRRMSATVRFEQINFGRAKFGPTNFGWSDVVDCEFDGIVDGLDFGALPVSDAPPRWDLSGVDMTHARPRRVEFRGVNLGNDAVKIALPEDEEHWRIRDWPGFLHRVADAIVALPDGIDKTTAQIWLEHVAKRTGPQQSEGFIARWDLDRLGGQRLVEIISTARR